ncbi:hypothetical protein M9H77_03955 [Catharanthus roseus]|uniref:Uncharacterized protein n=1 Tax=Catharanthus roseus TaxID=4058 RepID=A0ACC0CCY0_CATRO|nr:hypothetical protein M9H77_03955 [Catharanthus roseus]
MRETITKISNILRYSTWDSAQEQLEKLSIKWDSFTVNQVLKTHPPMEKSWLFFNWASCLKGFKHDQFTYTTILDIFGEARRISSMTYVFEQMQEKGIKIDAVTYTSLIHWLSNDGDIEGAINLWQEMIAKGCRPTIVSYTAYLKILFHHKREREATEVYKEMLEVGCSPNCYTYTVLMDHLANSGKFREVMEIFSKMQVAGVEPDKAACNILVEKSSRAGEIEVLLKVLEYMREKSLVLRHPIYQKALETLRTAGESDVLLRQVNPHLSQEQVQNNFHTFIGDSNSAICRGLILHLMNKKSLVAIDCLLEDLMGKDIKLDSGVISMIIEINCSRGRQAGAFLAFEYFVKLGIDVERTAYLALLGVFLRTNSFPKVVDIVHEMVRTGASLGTYNSALLIYRLGCTRDLVSAKEVFSLLPDEEKNTATYTALIAACFLSGDSEKGLETFETMKKQGINVVVGTYSVLLSGLEKSGRVREWEIYRKEKKSLQARRCSKSNLMEEKICNLLFSDDIMKLAPQV